MDTIGSRPTSGELVEEKNKYRWSYYLLVVKNLLALMHFKNGGNLVTNQVAERQ